MNTKQQEGYDLMKGGVKYLWERFGILVLLSWLGLLIMNIFSLGMDDSDTSGWNRSGLTVRKDAKTGIEYLSDNHGGMVRRESGK